MKQLNLPVIPFLLFIITTIFSSVLHAEALIDQSSNIFKFQQKLADTGNVVAQYKLALMYESGDGVTSDIEQAKHWYGRAAEAGSKAALQRKIYLRIKAQGFDQIKDTAWLNSVKADSNADKAEAMLLLGQLYAEGLAVNKDLSKSLELLQQVRVRGTANVDKQIALIKDEIDEQERSEQKRQALESENQQQAQKQQLSMQQAQKNQRLSAKKVSQDEKIKRYEKAMLKLRMEQKKIDEQQAWATGGVVSTADDEI